MQKKKRKVDIIGEEYRLIFDRGDSNRVDLIVNGRLMAKLFLASQCNSNEKTYVVGQPIIKQKEDNIIVQLKAKSNLWQDKKFTFICRDENIEYYYSFRGKSRIDNCQFFQGSLPDFKTVFNPEPNFADKRYYNPDESPLLMPQPI